MENRAHYALIGAFVLACLLAGVGFVYWIANVGGIGARAVYAVQFNEPLAGVTPGANVLFNGVRVGAVTAVNLDAKEPKRVTLLLSVSPSAPVRADTTASLSFQGFTGAPAIALKGGAPDAPPLRPENGAPPLLVVQPGSGESLTDAARETLTRVDGVIGQNAKPLNTAITGIASFADMLGRNSQRLEGILRGLENLTGVGKKETTAVYELAAAKDFPDLDRSLDVQIAIGDVNALLVFDSQKIQMRTASGAYEPLADAIWADTLPKLVQAKLVQSFENAHQLGSVGRPMDQFTPEYRLEVSIRTFQVGPEGRAQVEFAARLVGDKGVKAAKIFTAAGDAKGKIAEEIVAALGHAFQTAAADLVLWTITEAESDQSERSPKPL